MAGPGDPRESTLGLQIGDLLAKEWWAYDPTHGWIDRIYHGFNLFEGLAWLIVALLVWRRYRRHRNTSLELLYCGAFVTFGLSDFREAYHLHTWLLIAKAANLLMLVLLRRRLHRRYYPSSKAY